MPNTVAILNNIRDNASAEYVARVPLATRANITAVGNALSAYPVIMNEFTSTLVEKICITIFSQKIATNRLAPFKKGMLPYGSTIEEIFVEMARGIAYDKEGLNPLGRRKPTNISNMYHRQNRADLYEVTVSNKQVRQAFNSEEGVQNLISSLVSSMYSGANYDEYVIMKELLGSYTGYYDYEVNPIIDEASGKEFVKTTRKAVMDLSFMSNLYNAANVKSYCDVNDLVLFVNKDVIAEIDVEVLAKAFNMGKTDFEPTIVVLDDFGSATSTYGILCDKSIFMVWDTLNNVESIRNPQGMFTNYFMNIQQVLSMSKYKNAIRFKKVPVV